MSGYVSSVLIRVYFRFVHPRLRVCATAEATPVSDDPEGALDIAISAPGLNIRCKSRLEQRSFTCIIHGSAPPSIQAFRELSNSAQSPYRYAYRKWGGG
jgi:hypothetical protein